MARRLRVLVTLTAAVPIVSSSSNGDSLDEPRVSYRGSVECVHFLGKLFRTMTHVMTTTATSASSSVSTKSESNRGRKDEKPITTTTGQKTHKRTSQLNRKRRSLSWCPRRSSTATKRTSGGRQKCHSPRTNKVCKRTGHNNDDDQDHKSDYLPNNKWTLAAKTLLHVAVTHINITPKNEISPFHYRLANHILSLLTSPQMTLAELVKWTCNLALNMITLSVGSANNCQQRAINK